MLFPELSEANIAWEEVEAFINGYLCSRIESGVMKLVEINGLKKEYKINIYLINSLC